MNKLTHTQFLKKIKPELWYTPDSANYDLYEHFIDHILADGGDDYFANINHYDVAFELSKLVTPRHIEQYDNDKDTLDIYLELKTKATAHE